MLDWIFERNRHLDQQRCVRHDGCGVRAVPSGARHGYDGNGRILPFVSKAFTVMQYTAWALLFLITVWQLFRVFGGPVTEAEKPVGTAWKKCVIRLSDRICQSRFSC